FWTSERELRRASKSEKWDPGQGCCARRSPRCAHSEVAGFCVIPHVFTNAEQSTPFRGQGRRIGPYGPPQNKFLSGGCCFSFYSLALRAQDEGQPASHSFGGGLLCQGGVPGVELPTL